MKLLLRSAICLLILSALYHAAIPYFPFDHQRGRAAGLAMADRNRARARAYLELSEAPKVVLVGSSISAAVGSMPADWFNLSQAGGTPLTGLQIVAQHERAPDWVFIETNRIQHGPDSELVRELFDPHRRALLERVPALREHNRPSHVSLLIAKNLRDRGGRANSRAAEFALDSQKISPAASSAIRRANLDLLAREVPTVQLQRRIDELHESIDRLRRKGIRVAFFEVPEHPDSYATPLRRQLRRSVADAFPPSDYRWAPTSVAENFSTTDGVHLDRRSGERFSAQLRAWAATLPDWEQMNEDPAAIAVNQSRAVQ